MVSGAVLRLLVGALLSPAALLAGGATRAHPMHSTLTEVVEDEARRTLRATIRVFADDLGIAMSRSSLTLVAPGGPAWEEAAARYAARVFGVRDGKGRVLALHPCGIRRTAAVIWICLESNAVASTEGLQVRDAILCELYDDQVNVVQGNVGGARRSVLFVRGDGYRMLR